jgi:hypothetical protein
MNAINGRWKLVAVLVTSIIAVLVTGLSYIAGQTSVIKVSLTALTAQHMLDISDLRERISVTETQFEEILRRLDRIDDKLEGVSNGRLGDSDR